LVPTTPSQRLPIGERGNLSERRVLASLPTPDHEIPVRGVRPWAGLRPGTCWPLIHPQRRKGGSSSRRE